jgi:hypothetical protein
MTTNDQLNYSMWAKRLCSQKEGLDTAAVEWTLLDNCLHLLAYERMHRGAGEALATRIKARIADLDLRRAA